MIVGAAGARTIGFAQYLALTVLVGAACLAANAVLLVWMFRRELPTGRSPTVRRRDPRSIAC